ncbi:MAG: hypothetical protein DMF28_10210, partial [Verrucomicrobia bacterium]
MSDGGLLAVLWLSKIDSYGPEEDCRVERCTPARRAVRLHRSLIRRVGTTAAEEIVVSGVLLGATIGAILGGKAADLFGRRRVLLVTAAIFGIGALASAMAPSPAILIASRVVLGLAIGLASTNVPVYLSEVAPAHARGWVVSLFQLAVTVGIVVAYLIDYVFAGVEGWRWMLGLAVAPALVFGAGMFFLPETPRWLIRGGHHEVAHRVL